MNCCWEPIHPKELLSCRNAMLASAEIDRNVVDTGRIDNGEVFVAGIRSDTVLVDMTELDY